MPETLSRSERLQGAVWGHAVGDALGVPVEFTSRHVLEKAPVVNMRGYGTHNQPPGTWSDDTSLMLCTLENLIEGGDLTSLAAKFIAWRDEAYWTPHGAVFDIGGATSQAISRLKQGVEPLQAGGINERSNGNGSLMRILPVAFLPGLTDDQAADMAHDLSALTHRHPRSRMAGGLFILLARRLVDGQDTGSAYEESIRAGFDIYKGRPDFSTELFHFDRFLNGRLARLSEAEIRSTGYVVHTLEAAVWCLLNSRSFNETVLKAVNLGDDTDTTAAVAGGLAGAAGGIESIPVEWRELLAGGGDIESIISRWFE